jgi:hypothetical protein
VIGFLRLIRGCMYGGATNKYLEHTILDAQTKLLTLCQSSRMSNAEYLRSFCGLVDALEYLGGEIGVEESRITSYLQAQQQDPDDSDMWAAAKAAVREQFLGAMFIVKSDSKRYGALIATLQNDFISGHNCYPQTINAAYNMLVNYVNPNRDRALDLQDGGLSYMATEDEETTHEHGRGCGQGRWNRGGRQPCGRGRFQDDAHETHSHHDQRPHS